MSAYLFLGGSRHRQVLNTHDEIPGVVFPIDPETLNAEVYRKERVRFGNSSSVFVFVPNNANDLEVSRLVGELLFELWTEYVSGQVAHVPIPPVAGGG